MLWNIKPCASTPALLLCEKWLREALSQFDAYTPFQGSSIILSVCADAALEKEAYRLSFQAPDTDGTQNILIEGRTDAAVLYGVSDFVNVFLPKAEEAHTWMNPYYFVNPFDKPFKAQQITSSPDIARRGLWTWGHVIYDYKGYLENMARLKLNEIVIWNDCAPLNADDVVAYAHALGIRVIWGYSWGWDTKITLDLSDDAALSAVADRVVAQYKKEYAHLAGDGLYFQSFTETKDDAVNGRQIAKTVVDWVNGVCARILAITPTLELQFGLHATSVRTHMDEIARVDPRVRIVWEDCGAFPYYYLPEDTHDFPETTAFTKTLTTVRDGIPCGHTGVVTKGMCCLDWSGTFIHRAEPEKIGMASESEIAARLIQAKHIMKHVRSGWLEHGGQLTQIVQLLQAGDPDCQCLALLEDSLFDRHIWLCAAFFAATLWDCKKEYKKTLAEAALRPDVTM